MKKNKAFLIAILLCQMGICLGQAPTVKGHVSLSVKKGFFKCEFVVTDVPEISDYLILLNNGFNIRYFRKTDKNTDLYYNRVYEEAVSEESFGYYFPGKGGKGKYLPKSFKISYVGAFPVFADTADLAPNGDWKGNIAFNEKYLRATEQSVWYPIFYDKEKDKKYPAVNYEITVSCEDCKSVYLNGSDVQNGKNKLFRSKGPEQLLFFAGNYKVANVDSTCFLNPDLSPEQISHLAKLTGGYRSFYQEKIGIPYVRNIVYMQANPVSKLNSWLFVTYPSIVNVGFNRYSFGGMFGSKDSVWFKQFIAHELAHYYFGSYKKFNSEIGGLIEEGFAEYLSLKCIRAENDSLYSAKISDKIKKTEKGVFLPVSAIHKKADFENLSAYYYSYMPLILLAIEKEIGEAGMYKWIHALVTSTDDLSNYETLKKTLDGVLNDPAKMQDIESALLASPEALPNALIQLSKK